jgi:hypothetical protein
MHAVNICTEVSRKKEIFRKEGGGGGGGYKA